MRSPLLVLAVAVLSVAVPAAGMSETDSLFMPGKFVIKGDMAPKHGDVLSFAVTELFGLNKVYDVNADSAGQFFMEVPMTGPMQEIYLYVDKTVTVPVIPGDTVSVSLGDDGGAKIKGSTPEAALDMELAMRLHQEMRPRFLDLNMKYYDMFYSMRSDSARIAYVRDVDRYIGDYIDIVDRFESEHGRVRCHDYFYESGYFNMLSFFAWSEMADSISFRFAGENQPHHRVVGADRLKYPGVGRTLDSYIRGATSRALYGNSYQSMTDTDKAIKQLRYMRSIAADSIIADYVDCEELLGILHSGRFRDYGKQLSDYCLGANGSKAFREIMVATIGKMERSRSGCRSPQLSLNGLDGRNYKLDDFKGRFVLLDFWSPGCGPCRSEFKNMKTFKEMFAGYADRISYVTVCVLGDNPAEWQTMRSVIEKYGLDDLNTTLDREGSDELYHIAAYPTYVLLDPEGRIVNFNNDRPTVIMSRKQGGETTEFERALNGEMFLPER